MCVPRMWWRKCLRRIAYYGRVAAKWWMYCISWQLCWCRIVDERNEVTIVQPKATCVPLVRLSEGALTHCQVSHYHPPCWCPVYYCLIFIFGWALLCLSEPLSSVYLLACSDMGIVRTIGIPSHSIPSPRNGQLAPLVIHCSISQTNKVVCFQKKVAFATGCVN